MNDSGVARNCTSIQFTMTTDRNQTRAVGSSRWAKYGAAAVAAAILGLTPSSADAQNSTFYLDRLVMAGQPEDGIGIWRPRMGKETRFFGQLGVGYALNPLRLDNHLDDLNNADLLAGAPVENQVITYLDAGVEILERASIQVSFPMIVFQNGNPTHDYEAGLDQAVSLKTFAPMDLRFEGRFTLLGTGDDPFKLGVNGAVYVPTGNADSFGGNGKASGAFGVAGEYDFKLFAVTLNLGARIRPEAHLNELTIHHELTYGAGGYLPLLEDKTLRLGAEIFGATGLTSATFGELDASPLEWQVNAKKFFLPGNALYAGLGAGTRLNGGIAPDLRVVAVLGGSVSLTDSKMRSPDFKYVIEKEKDTDNDGYPDVIDLCPADAEDGKDPKPSDGCPHLPDRDGDGIPDIADKCPDVPEDLDGVDDRDGCPEDDADEDKISDAEDKCPKEPGEVNTEDPTKHGCPTFVRRITGSSEIQITKQVEFKFDSWIILPNSFPILDEVVRLLKVNREIKLVSIEGHTDKVGGDEYNNKLSKDRATSVRDYLINHGIEKERLVSSGFGSQKPVGSNDTDEGRQRNRRVEFHIKNQAIEGR